MAENAFTLLPARLEDVPLLAETSSTSFEADVQTEMKSHGKSPFNMKEYMLSNLPKELANPKIRIIKAVEQHTGTIMGFCTWGFRGIEPPSCIFPGEEAFYAGPREQQQQQLEEGNPETKPNTETASDQPTETDPPNDNDMDDPIARLESLTSQDFQAWMHSIMPPGTSCLFVIGLYVSPAFQNRGVGSALLKWGTDLVDRHGVFAWVHSSAGAWRVYEKAGFRTVRTLEVDLDEFAPVPAPAERYEGGRWGRYVFRYMVYGALPEMMTAS